MATGTATASMSLHQANASNGDAQSLQHFYYSLFRLQDDVFSGRHPRIRLPDEVMGLVMKVKQQSAINSTGLPGGDQTTLKASSTTLLPGLGASPAAQGARPPATPAAFDPVLLTKSHELVSAEIAIERQKIEKTLAEQVAASKPRFSGRGADYATNYDTSLDVDAAWDQARRVIQHQTAWSERARSESFDENDYYSSQAMSWSTEHTESNGAENGKAAQSQHKQPAVMQDRAQTAQQLPLPSDYEDLPDEDDEDDYSPPPPDQAPATADTTIVPQQKTHVQANSSRPVQPFDSRYEYNRPAQPQSKPHVIHSHIREPFMPQPARVSPLALGKVAAVEQAHLPPTSIHPHHIPLQPPAESGSEFANNDTPREQSPAAPKETMKVSKKRKRKEERAAAREEKKSRRNAARRAEDHRQAGSPGAYIKPEPTSPPPFASFTDMPPPPRRRVIEYADEDVQVLSPYGPHTRPSYREYDDYPPPPPGYRYAEPISPEQMRRPSPVPTRRIARADQDLRRVASLQYAGRPFTPSAAYPPYEHRAGFAEPQRRAVSHMQYEREPPAVYGQSWMAPPRYVRDRSRSPEYDGRASVRPRLRPYDRADAMERIASPMTMPPPPVPTRIVEDKYGNRYYATPAPPDAIPEMRVRESVAPPSRYYDEYPPPQPVYERPSTRASLMPPPSRRLYEDDLPPPPMPIPQRRIEEDPAVEAYRQYRQRETSMRPPELRPRTAARDDFPLQHMMREPPPPSGAPEGRRIVSYDEPLTSPRHPPSPKAPGYSAMPPPYSGRPEPDRPDEYRGHMGPPHGHGRDMIPRHGSAMAMAPPEHIIQMPWERAERGGGGHGGYDPFAGGPRNGMDRLPPAVSREGRWAEVDEGHGGGRRVLPNGEIDEGYGGGKRVIYHF